MRPCSTDARKRISAIKQYSSLGSGFKIAMRDLEIRGAGNLLGPQQSGHITAVGFELYCQLLKQSVSALKGEKVQHRVQVEARFDFLAFNPGDESRSSASKFKVRASKSPAPEIQVPREVALSSGHELVEVAADPSTITSSLADGSENSGLYSVQLYRRVTATD